MTRRVDLPSGAVLVVNAAPFADAKALYQALLVELRLVSIQAGQQVQEMFKNFFCAGFSSPAVDKAIEKCLTRCIYEDSRGQLKIDKDTFEPPEAREDYLVVLMEVAKENINPFAKSLFASFKGALETIDVSQVFESKTTTSSFI